MASFPKTVTAQGGEELILRPCEATDEQALIDFFTKRVPEGDRLFLRDDVTDPSVIKGWLQKMDHSRVFPLLAFHGDDIVGDATLHTNAHGWSRHVGEIRVVVARDWQRKGVAQLLTNQLIQRAHKLGLEILEAHVLEGQHGAQRALEALGFHSETVLRNRATDRTGRRRNILLMTNDVSELWRRMEELMSELELGGPHSGRY